MSNYPDFSPHGYQIITELGRNREGGRITWLASNINTGKEVVLKQFCFAQVGSTWSAYDTYQREIEVLRGLNHPGIPSYLGSFATPDGFCMIQKYIDAPSLGVARSFTPEQIKEIAVKALEILVYLQNRTLVVIHRDIKPENILVNDQLEVYLIDFGFARIGTQEVFGSSVFKGTPGFIPPEQMRQPTKASDLYGLGATLICLLTSVKSGEIQNLTDHDDPYLINFRHLLPRLNLSLINWLEKMVQPRQSNRFANAQTALEALKVLDSHNIIRQPNVEFSTTTLNFRATILSEELSQRITISNSVPETHLEGRWEVAPHRHDPPHTPDYHAWISITPAQFSNNYVDCYVQVDMSKLMADKLYKRQLFLHTNAYPEIQIVNIEVSTAPLLIERELIEPRKKIPYATLIWLFLICEIATMGIAWVVPIFAAKGVVLGLAWDSAWSGALSGSIVGAIIGAVIMVPIRTVYMLWNNFDSRRNYNYYWHVEYFDMSNDTWWLYNLSGVVSTAMALIGIIVGTVVGFMARSGPLDLIQIGGVVLMSALMLGCGYPVLNVVIGVVIEILARTIVWLFSNMLLPFTAGLGVSVGMGFIIGFHNFYILLALAVTGLSLFITMLLYPLLKHRRLIAKYRKSEQNLIQP
ncbi:serine/threonine protein kinase [Tolypothrix sp. NIES-4075]|uniref:serine/threonine protein kinase n=1 Tax=Tolypothrix sp. NIES-4075 TaxID=2005459 RepID=UPI000B5CD63E|nr:protein kinase [Tolypothrix sp. NIES-4075]GAX40068.1 serine/threonine protein kinase [Tolypothrix sp. NIES-4075]